MKITPTWLSVVGCLAISTRFCCSPTNTAGNSSDVGNARVSGTIYEPDGTTPAAGVRVAIRPRNTLADTSGFGLPKRFADTATVTTDDSGRFVIDSIDTGTYVIEAASGNNAVLIDSVAVTSQDSTVELPPDTLKPAGALKGVIKLSEGGDPRKVFVLAFGIDRFARVEADGRFRFQNLAEAAYDLRIISSLDDYGVLDMPVVAVISADTTDLDTIELPFEGIPTPKGLSLTYDTLKQIVTLTWNQADTSLIQGYNVYRTHSDSTGQPVQFNSAILTDTTFSDSTALQDQTYTYQVKALDKDGNEGLLSAAAGVEVLETFSLSDSIGVYGTGADQLFMPRVALACQTGHMILDVVDPYPSAVAAKVFDSSGNYLNSFTVRQSDISDNVYTLNAAVDSQDNLYSVFRDSTFKYDVNGNLIEGYALSIPEMLSKTTCILTRDSLVIYAINRAEKTIVARNLSGDTLHSFTHDAASVNMNGIAVDGNRNIFAADRSLDKIYKFSPEGTLIHEWGAQGTGANQFGRIEGITLDPAGRLYVDDSENSRIAVFGNDGSLITKFESFVNTKKWQGTVNDNSEHLTVFVTGDRFCLLEGNAFKKLFIYKANSRLP